jgi:hypothetical protein
MSKTLKNRKYGNTKHKMKMHQYHIIQNPIFLQMNNFISIKEQVI